MDNRECEEEQLELDWIGLKELEKDLCFLYYQLSEVRGIDGDLPFSLLYRLDYWNILGKNLTSVPDAERRFIEQGCLVMILTMCWETIDGAGNYITPHITACRSAVEKFSPLDAQSISLVAITRHALDLVEYKRGSRDELHKQSQWVNRHIVRRFFAERAS